MNDPHQYMEQLYRDVGPALLAYFRRQQPLAGAAEDLLQDTFVRAFLGMDRVRKAVSPRAYLFGVARHVCLDALRRLRPSADLLADEIASERRSDDPRLEQVHAAIAELSEKHREPLLLKLQDELSYQEIAEVLGVPLGTVRSRLYHAVAHLKEKLNPLAAQLPEARGTRAANFPHEN